jgi:hypothetical protein
LIVLVGLGLRVYLAATAAMISRDGVVFIGYARQLAVEPVAEMRRQAQHPLYPALVLVFERVADRLAVVLGDPPLLADPVRRWQVAGMLVTLLCGIGVVVAVYALTRTLFDEWVALVAAALAATAAEFCQLSADALSDMPHLLAYLVGLTLAVRGLQTGSMVRLLAGGVMSGLAYLIRPEGAEVAVVALVAALFIAPGRRLRRRVLAGITIVAGAAIVASPYMLVTGKLVQKKPIHQFFEGTTPQSGHMRDHDIDSMSSIVMVRSLHADASARSDGIGQPVAISSATCEHPRGLKPAALCKGAGAEARRRSIGSFAFGKPLLRAFGLIAEDFSRALRVTYLLPALAWLIIRRPAGRTLEVRVLVAAMTLHLGILVGLLIRFDYWDLFSMRHVLVLAALTLPFSAAGLVGIARLVPAGRRTGAMIMIALVLFASTLPWLLERRFADERYLRVAGEWIRAHSTDRPRILTTRHRVAFYADGVQIPGPLEADPDAILTEARSTRPVWLAFDERLMLRQRPDFFAALEAAVGPPERLEPTPDEVGRVPGLQGRAIVYRYRSPP